MNESEFTQLERTVDELAAKCPSDEVEYWRGYRLGAQRRFRGVGREEEFQHAFWMKFTLEGRGATGFAKYARGYQDGFATMEDPPETEIALLRSRAIAGTRFSPRGADREAAVAGRPQNCWEFMKCGREKGGEHENDLGVCPAYPNYGRSCARLIGTLCGGDVHGSMARKLNDCMKCPFFQSPHYERITEND